MIKAFISHSSKQKKYVAELVNIIGKDCCIVDCYDFDAAYKSLNEIYAKIDACTIFVFLVSKDSLESDWCKKEISRCKEKLKSGELARFWPFIIDEKVSITDTPEWIHKEQCFNLKYFKTAKALAREIEQKFRTIVWRENPHIRNREILTVGRNKDIDVFEEKFYSGRRSKIRATIISGREGVGKEAFAYQCMQKIGKDAVTIPFRIDLSPKDSVEDLILELNEITGKFSENQMTEIVLPSSSTEKQQYAVSLINELYNLRTVLFIEDNMSIVCPNRTLPEWFSNVIKDSNLSPQIGMFILSRITPKTTIESSYPQIISIALDPLSKSDRRKLFYQLIDIYHLENIQDCDVEEFIEKLNQSPIQLDRLAQALQANDLKMVKADLNEFVSLGDKKLKPLFDMFSEEDEKELLIVLSRFNFVSYKVLKDVYKDQYEYIETNILPKLLANGLASSFGPSGCFIRLDYALADYIKRNHMKLSREFEAHVNCVLEEYLASDVSLDSDLSVYLYNTSTRILKGLATEKDFLVPSIVIKSIVELYNDQKYKEVIKHCEYVLKECDRYDNQIIREIRLWYCSALCREQESIKFYDEVRYFDGTADYKFLRGFYLRIEGRPKEAEKWYKEALDKDANMQRAKREYVSVLLEQRKYDDALDQARENFKSRPENTYHIHAYFRCLIKQQNLKQPDKDELLNLIKQVDSSHSPKKAEIVCAMQLEYDINISNKPVDVLLNDICDAERRFPRSPNIGRVANDYRFRQQIDSERISYREDI